MRHVTARIAQRCPMSKHYIIAHRPGAAAVRCRAPRKHTSSERYRVTVCLEAAPHDNLTGIRERPRDHEPAIDEEDTLPASAHDGEIAARIHDRYARRADRRAVHRLAPVRRAI